MRRRPTRFALVALTALLACRGSETPPLSPELLILCFQSLAVTVDTPVGGTPRIGWSPRCGATYLEVSTPDRQEVVWIVQGDTGKIAPGVTYGVAPGSYTSRLGPVPLVRGRPYLARVGIQIDENSFGILGEGAFIP